MLKQVQHDIFHFSPFATQSLDGGGRYDSQPRGGEVPMRYFVKVLGKILRLYVEKSTPRSGLRPGEAALPG
jgi:hypothetical protein